MLSAGNGQVLNVTFTPNDTVNYASITQQAQIDVAKAPLTITVEDKTMVTDAAVPMLTAHYKGFVNGDSAASLDTPVTLTTAVTANSLVGAYDIMVSGAADLNYAIAFVKGTLTVQPAGPSLVTTNSDHGSATSYFVFQAQGFQPGESVAITVDGRGVLTLKADANGGLGGALLVDTSLALRA